VQAGKLRHRVIIQQRASGENAYGEPNGAWGTWKTVWAEVAPTSGVEREQDQQTSAVTSHRVTVRYINGLTTDHRILFGTRVLGIHEIVNTDERNIEQVLRCSEVMPAS
jgi:SPP1 family predicted phage head-tail adaptor